MEPRKYTKDKKFLYSARVNKTLHEKMEEYMKTNKVNGSEVLRVALENLFNQ